MEEMLRVEGDGVVRRVVELEILERDRGYLMPLQGREEYQSIFGLCGITALGHGVVSIGLGQ